jgi:hypothetical protein
MTSFSRAPRFRGEPRTTRRARAVLHRPGSRAALFARHSYGGPIVVDTRFVSYVPAALALSCVFGVVPACAIKTSTVASDSSGAEDVSETESNVEVLGTSFVGSDGQSVATASFAGKDDLEIQANGGGTLASSFLPAGCLTISTDAAAMESTYTFAGCTGPLGLVHLQGTIMATWQLAPSMLTISFTAQNFAINGATITSWQATAVVTANGQARAMTWNAQLTGTTASGRAFSRTNQKDLSWTVGQACLAVSGQSSGTITGAHLQTTITSYQRCQGACPQAGSEINVTNEDNGETIDIVYEGGREGDLTINGKSEMISLLCGG